MVIFKITMFFYLINADKQKSPALSPPILKRSTIPILSFPTLFKTQISILLIGKYLDTINRTSKKYLFPLFFSKKYFNKLKTQQIFRANAPK
jgi:hypothetical protein